MVVPVVALVGATATGKSDLAIEVALRLGGEVVNTDALQVYRGMDIGTAKVPPADRCGVPHHLLDLLEVTESASVAEFQRQAREVIEDCRSRGVPPILVGGSALYTNAVLDELDFPGTDPEVRARLEDELAEHGSAEMHARLAERAPAAAADILPSNGRRIVRALEVVQLTGSFTPRLPAPVDHFDRVVRLGLGIERPVLDARIATRVQRMWDAGLVDEVRSLVDRGLREGRTARGALGYRQVLDLLDGRVTDAEARESTVAGTRRFARKQESWWRRDRRIVWLRHDDRELISRALAELTNTPA